MFTLQSMKEELKLSDEQVAALKPILEENLALRGNLIQFDPKQLDKVLTPEQLNYLKNEQIKRMISDHDQNATAFLRAVASACWAYARDHQGKNPLDIESLTNASPPYLSSSYCGTTNNGYIFTCKFSSDG